MSYSTNLYAVDLAELKSLVGSRDARLLKRFRPTKRKTEPEKGPRVKVTQKGKMFLNGESVSFKELTKELNRRKWKRTVLFFHVQEDPRMGGWGSVADLVVSINKSYHWSHFRVLRYCQTESQLAGVPEEDGFSSKDAAAELVEGRLTRPDEAHQYGYALKLLCEALGTFLANIPGKGGMLEPLDLKSPLSRNRSPVRLPKWDDFPTIGYLTAAEVEREVRRVVAMDLFSPDKSILSDRKKVLRSLQKAYKKKSAVVAFYY